MCTLGFSSKHFKPVNSMLKIDFIDRTVHISQVILPMATLIALHMPSKIYYEGIQKSVIHT